MSHIIYKNKNGERIKSVTTIIGQNIGWNKEILLAWQAKEFRKNLPLFKTLTKEQIDQLTELPFDPTKIKKKAADKGTLVHHYLSMDFYGKEIDQDFKKNYDLSSIVLAETALKVFKKYLENNKLSIIDSEISLISEQYQYGGTLDGRIIKPDNTVILLDFKTSKDVYEDHIIQLGAYNQLLIENNYGTPNEYLVIHIKKDFSEEEQNIIEPISIPNEMIEEGFAVFKSLLDIQNRKEKLKLKK
jgi:hypothetical protein